jgi:hypothetical protein
VPKCHPQDFSTLVFIKKNHLNQNILERLMFFFHGSNQTPFNRDLILSSISSLLAIVLRESSPLSGVETRPSPAAMLLGDG